MRRERSKVHYNKQAPLHAMKSCGRQDLSGKNSNKPQNSYDTYVFSKKEWLLVLAKGIGLVLVIAVLFYDSVIAMLFLLPLLVVVVRQTRQKKGNQKKMQLAWAFKEGIQAVLSAVSAGYSIENAFAEALKDLRMLYAENQPIVCEFQLIVRGLQINEPIEKVLADFAARSGLEDVQMFCEVFSVCKRSGGELHVVLTDTVSRISQKAEVYREIDTFLSARRLEQHIMDLVPLGILLYVRVASPSFLLGLYHNTVGIVLMSICLLVYAAAYLLSEHFLKIEV